MPYWIVVYPTPEDEGYFAVVPDLPGCTAHGATAEEAVHEAHVAMRLWLDVAPEDEAPIPRPAAATVFEAVGSDRGSR